MNMINILNFTKLNPTAHFVFYWNIQENIRYPDEQIKNNLGKTLCLNKLGPIICFNLLHIGKNNMLI